MILLFFDIGVSFYGASKTSAEASPENGPTNASFPVVAFTCE
jgi:hypothetical protein